MVEYFLGPEIEKTTRRVRALQRRERDRLWITSSMFQTMAEEQFQQKILIWIG